jgi:hypothetical protein
MTTLKVNAIEPEGATTNLVIGESGQNTVISNNDLRANVLQDAGGNALFTSNGSGVLSGVNSGFGSSMVLLSTQTASNSASISFTSGIDSTYGEYIFRFYAVNPATDQANFTFQCNATDSTSYDETMTTTFIQVYHDEGDTTAAMVYGSGKDQAQGTAFQTLSQDVGNGADESCAGELYLFNPSNTTYVKHFYSTFNAYQRLDYTMETFVAGYINTTTAIDDIQFKMSSGNFDGKIKMWGVK